MRQINAFKSIAAEMTEGTRSEPGTLGYEWFAGADGKRFRLVEPMSCKRGRGALYGSGGAAVGAKLAAVSTVDGFEFYGDPGPKVSAMAAGFGAGHVPILVGNRPLTRMPGHGAGHPQPRRPDLLFIQINLLVLVPGYGSANLCGRLAELCLLVGEEPFLGAGGALGSVQPLKQLLRLVCPSARSQRQLQGNW